MLAPDDTLFLYPELNTRLVELLRSLRPEDWERQTVARLWKVKDVAAHLLDVTLRRVALHRDGWSSPPARPVRSQAELIGYLNEQNATWVNAARRLSPPILIDMLAYAHREMLEQFRNMDPDAPAVYPVSWAGESLSTNRFDIAREYTEHWLHQQQIRDAIGDQTLLHPAFYNVALQIFLRAWPFVLNDTAAAEGTLLKTVIRGVPGAEWYAIRTAEKWLLESASSLAVSFPDAGAPQGITEIDREEAWKLFSKSRRKEDIIGHYTITGNEQLATKVLDMISVMA